MDVSQLPFNRLAGLAPADGTSYLLQLPESPGTLNHLGTVHASAQFALAEAASGQFLVNEFPQLDGRALAVVRTFSGKFRGAGRGILRAAATIAGEARANFAGDLERRGRGSVAVDVEVHDANGATTLAATFDWFVQMEREG